MAGIALEGLILVSSTTERGVADDDKNADVATRKAQVKGSAAQRKRPAATGKEDAHVSQVLRTVYQRAVDEDIPSEMLDLLSKLD
ncbi:NepR family anti-sigma factor [Sphingomonas bisphenolicum]|uniref:NepR family anti-sigma factor n=1 Tax=Sphingomonas bisphenolicum TaxID=296544 RepID=UPI0021C3839F|nr:NepR family anti-sigma factor [Sphingomonas bisphenolicum]